MGRNLFRRTALILFCVTVPLSAKPLEAKQGAALPPQAHDARYRDPLQNHAAEKAWSFDIDFTRPEIAGQIDMWTSFTGRKILAATSKRYFPFRKPVDEILRESELPWEISALPVIESSWRFHAVSSSGAAGPWQLLPATAEWRGLTIDAWRDDRRDLWLSTQAAVTELQFCYGIFSDWLMTMASYNAGPTRVRRIRDENGTKGYWDTREWLPPETQNYVPKVLAAAYVMAHAGRNGFPVEWNDPPEWNRITLDRSIHLDYLSGALKTDPWTVRLANQALQHPITPPPPYTISVPQDVAGAAEQWLNLQENRLPERYWRYTIRSGDTLSEIAEQADISMLELQYCNPGVAGRVIRAGEKLYIPGNQPPDWADSDELPLWTAKYTVRTGDTFWSLSRNYGVTPEQLAEANSRSLNGVLSIGSVLRVPSAGEAM